MKDCSQIFELYGYPVDSWSAEAQDNLSRCKCPFMNAECDGGGNRFSSGISLSADSRLRPFFPGKRLIQSGVCSLQLHKGAQPWIVCPRRLLNYRSDVAANHQDEIKDTLCNKSGLVKGMRYSVWSEVKVKCAITENGRTGLFDYTFDYVITGRKAKPVQAISDELGISHAKTLRMLADSGFTTTFRNNTTFCEDYPDLPLVIVEVMTSSTCGGNKKNRTQIAQLFEDTVLRLNGVDVKPGGPTINYRQVWARMVSQLLVKSQIGKAWGGTTFWVLQDLLAKYISDTTALNFSDFLAEHSDEVNVISGGYGDELSAENRSEKIIKIKDVNFYSGKVSPLRSEDKTFSDIIRLGCTPPREELVKRLLSKKPCASFVF